MTETHLIDTRTGRFGYLARGDEAAPLILCLHGFPDHARSFEPLMKRLAGAGYRAVAPWMRGYAPSVLEGPYDADSLAADVCALADALAPGRRCMLVGHDWGAVATYAALQDAPRRFDRAVTMAVPHPLAFLSALRTQPAQLARSWYMFFFQLPRIPERVVRAGGFAFVRRLWQRWSPGYQLDEAAWSELAACLDASMPAPIEYYRAMLQPPRDAARRLRDAAKRPPIATPVLHLQGADDGCIAPSACRGQARYFAGPFASEVVESAGHFLQLEAPNEVARRVIDWLGRSHRAASQAS